MRRRIGEGGCFPLVIVVGRDGEGVTGWQRAGLREWRMARGKGDIEIGVMEWGEGGYRGRGRRHSLIVEER